MAAYFKPPVSPSIELISARCCRLFEANLWGLHQPTTFFADQSTGISGVISVHLERSNEINNCEHGHRLIIRGGLIEHYAESLSPVIIAPPYFPFPIPIRPRIHSIPMLHLKKVLNQVYLFLGMTYMARRDEIHRRVRSC